jgi:hypothetical protein
VCESKPIALQARPARSRSPRSVCHREARPSHKPQYLHGQSRSPEFGSGRADPYTRRGLRWDERNFARAYDRLRNLAKTTGVRSLTFHCARHTFASWALEGGRSIKWVQERLGHSNAELTLRTYSHLMPTEGDELDFLVRSRPDQDLTKPDRAVSRNTQGPRRKTARPLKNPWSARPVSNRRPSAWEDDLRVGKRALRPLGRSTGHHWTPWRPTQDGTDGTKRHHRKATLNERGTSL